MLDNNPIVHVAVGIVFNERNEVLIAQRPPDKSYSGLWEFPGGKAEANETILQALKRELQEEVGIQVLAAQAWLQLDYAYSDRHVFLHIWRVLEFLGEPAGLEGQNIQWIPLNRIDQFQFLPANRDILKKLCEYSEFTYKKRK